MVSKTTVELIFTGSVAMILEVTSGSLVNAADGVISTRGARGPVRGRSRTRAPTSSTTVSSMSMVSISSWSRMDPNIATRLTGSSRSPDAELEIDLGGVIDVPSNFTNYGTVTVGGGGTIRFVGSAGVTDVPSNFTNYGTVTVGGGGSIRFNGTSGESLGMTVSNHGFIDILTDGTFDLTSAVFDNPPSGWVRGTGTLDLDGAAGVSFDGTVSPGLSPGILTVEGPFDEGPNAAIIIEIGGESPGTNLDRLDVSGTLVRRRSPRCQSPRRLPPAGW